MLLLVPAFIVGFSPKGILVGRRTSFVAPAIPPATFQSQRDSGRASDANRFTQPPLGEPGFSPKGILAGRRTALYRECRAQDVSVPKGFWSGVGLRVLHMLLIKEFQSQRDSGRA